MESSIYIVVLILINIAVWIILSMIPRLKHKKMIFLILSFLSLWIFLSIRKPYSDMVTYENYFRSIDINHLGSIFEKDWEFFFKLLLYGIRFITDNPRAMYCISAFVTLLGPFLFIKRYSKNYLLTMVMFITVGTFSMQFFILRQAIALSVFLMFFHFLGEKKLFKFCVGVLIAAMFHKTAFILLLLYPFVNIPPSKFKNVLVVVMTMLVLIFSSQISSLLMSGFYSEYTDRVSSGNGVALFLLYIFMYLFYLLIEKRTVQVREEGEMVKASFFTLLFQFFAIQNNAFSRLANYTRDSFCILVPNAIQKLDKKTKVFFSVATVFSCIIFVVVTGIMEGYSIL